MELWTKDKIQVFLDSADTSRIAVMARHPDIEGFTTNASLMRKAKITDYAYFARTLLQYVENRPISFSVLADDFADMVIQARIIASWGENVYVKIPITNTLGQLSCDVIKQLAAMNIKLNVTALMTMPQIQAAISALGACPSAYLSVFAGRIADTGRDPLSIMQETLVRVQGFPHIQLIWASAREVWNLFQAAAIRCPVITLTEDLIKKLPLGGKNLDEFSLETVQMFYQDALQTGLSLTQASYSIGEDQLIIH